MMDLKVLNLSKNLRGYCSFYTVNKSNFWRLLCHFALEVDVESVLIIL